MKRSFRHVQFPRFHLRRDFEKARHQLAEATFQISSNYSQRLAVEMITSRLFQKRFALMTLFLAFLHLVMELGYTFKAGQHFLGLLPDLVADGLLVWGSVLLIGNPRAAGLICGAWGFTLCLHYRSWAWRFEDYLMGTINETQLGVMYLLAATMLVSIVCFVLTILMNLELLREADKD